MKFETIITSASSPVISLQRKEQMRLENGKNAKAMTVSEAAQGTLWLVVARKHLSVEDYVLCLPSSKG